jgi:hypothetical protein
VEVIATRLPEPARSKIIERLNMARVNDELHRQRVLLEDSSRVYGRNHPRMAEIRKRIATLEQPLARSLPDRDRGHRTHRGGLALVVHARDAKQLRATRPPPGCRLWMTSRPARPLWMEPDEVPGPRLTRMTFTDPPRLDDGGDPARSTVRPGADWQPSGTWQDITYATADGIAKITINRPEKRNAFRPQTLFELARAFELARMKGDLRLFGTRIEWQDAAGKSLAKQTRSLAPANTPTLVPKTGNPRCARGSARLIAVCPPSIPRKSFIRFGLI